MKKNDNGTWTATTLDVLSQFRDMKNGGLFTTQDGAFFSLNTYMFSQCKEGLIDSVTFAENGLMPASTDANGNPRPETKATVIVDIKESTIANRVKNLRDLRLQVDEKKITKELAAI